VRGPLHYANFRRTFLARIVSGAGSWMQTVAAGWLVYEITNSAAAVGVLTVVSRGPGILLSGLGGQLADRYDGRRLIILLAAIEAVAATLLAVLGWSAGTGASVLLIYLAVLVIGAAGALASAAQQTVVTASVPPELAKRATGLASVAFNISRLVGPALGGVLVVWLGVGWCFALNAVSYLFVAFAVWGLSLPPRKRSQPRRLREAARIVRRDLLLRDLMIGAALFSLIVAPIQELAPSIAAAHGEGAHLLGFLLAAMALGGIIGNRIRTHLEGRGAGNTLLVSGALFAGALALAILGLTSAAGIGIFGSDTYDYALAIVAMVFGGIAWDLIYVVGMTGIQLRSEEIAGVMIGLFLTVTITGLTVGALAMGLLFDYVGLGATLLVGGGLMAAIALRFGLGGVGERAARGAAERAIDSTRSSSA